MIQQHEINILKNVIEKATGIGSVRLAQMAEFGIRDLEREMQADAEDKAHQEAMDKAPPDDSYLLGSSVQPSTFRLSDGAYLSLGDVVAAAHTKSGLLASAWNAMDEAAREQYIAAEVAALDLYKEPASVAQATVTAAAVDLPDACPKQDTEFQGGENSPPPSAPDTPASEPEDLPDFDSPAEPGSELEAAQGKDNASGEPTPAPLGDLS